MAVTEDPSYPSVCFAGNGKETLCSHKLNCATMCQTTDSCLAGCFNWLHSGLSNYWLVTSNHIWTCSYFSYDNFWGKKKQILTEYYPYVWKSVDLFDSITVNITMSNSIKYLTVLCFWSEQADVRKLTWRSRITVCGSLRRPIYFKHLFARHFLLNKKHRRCLVLSLSYNTLTRLRSQN